MQEAIAETLLIPSSVGIGEGVQVPSPEQPDFWFRLLDAGVSITLAVMALVLVARVIIPHLTKKFSEESTQTREFFGELLKAEREHTFKLLSMITDEWKECRTQLQKDGEHFITQLDRLTDSIKELTSSSKRDGK